MLSRLGAPTGELVRTGPVTGHGDEREHPGDLIHVDVKELGRIPPGGGRRALGWRGPGLTRVRFRRARIKGDSGSRALNASAGSGTSGCTSRSVTARRSRCTLWAEPGPQACDRDAFALSRRGRVAGAHPGEVADVVIGGRLAVMDAADGGDVRAGDDPEMSELVPEPVEVVATVRARFALRAPEG